jgi:thiosulfate dehydrogenase (quinone) large subunit
MSSYFSAVAEELKDWKKAVLTIVFTLVRLYYGWTWIVNDGLEKLSWFTNGKQNSAGLIKGLITNLAGPKVVRFDPLHLNNIYAWVAQNVFLGIPRATDCLVVICELVVGLSLFLGFRVFWGAFVAIFLNTQFISAGSFNNFGYIWTDLAFLKFAKYADLLGVSGYLRFKKGKKLL